MEVLFAILIALVAVSADDLCTERYRKATPAHTACFVDSSKLVSSGVTKEQKTMILDMHNDLRGKVVISEGVPTNLLQVVWDDKVAAIAEKHAKQCLFEHDRNRDVLEYPSHVGQNIALGYGNWEGAINAWYNEIKNFKYGVHVNKTTGHFSQLVNSRVSRIGCGFALCEGNKKLYVCNYYKGQFNYIKPFQPGEKRCSACEVYCVNGLCAGRCLGKMCMNGGYLDLGSCECKCTYPYTGERCTETNCPTTENVICGTVYKPDKCKYSNVKRECGLMCGPCFGKIEKYKSASGCEYHGVRKSTEQCAELGNDWSTCASRGGTWGCSKCEKYSNIPAACPKTCGLCD